MWNWLQESLVSNPEIGLFLTLGLGFLVGKLSVKGIALGAITATLLMGVVIGAIVEAPDASGNAANIVIPAVTKQVFFLLFLFALGYRVGPQFFSGLKGSGKPQALFTLVLLFIGIGSAIGASILLGYDPGLAAGLTAGALTQSSIIGVAQESIAGLSESSSTLKEWSDLVPVGYAVTYIFGTIGAAIYCSSIAPRLLGIKDLPKEAKEEEERLGFDEPIPDTALAYRDVRRRAFQLPDNLESTTVAELEARMLERAGGRVHIDQIKSSGAVTPASTDSELNGGDAIAVAATMVASFTEMEEEGYVEIQDPELLSFLVEKVNVVITSDRLVGVTLGTLRDHPEASGVFLDSLHRSGTKIPLGTEVKLAAGDEVTVEGTRPLIERAIAVAGYPERSTDQSDMVMIGIGIAIGAIIGIPSITLGAVPFSLTSSVGAMFIGLLVGWRRSKRPTFGRIPPGAQWFFETVGLAAFVGIVGLNAGPSFVSGVSEYGLGLLGAGAVVTLLPLVAGTYIAKYVFKFDPIQTLGMLTGAQTTTAAIGAVREAADSSVPLLGFTVPYAIGNIVLSIGGALVVAVLA